MKFKRIAALTVAFSCAGTLAPTSLNIAATSVYAASTGDYLSDISLETSKGKDITVYTKSSCSSKYKLSRLDSSDKVPLTLYAKVSSTVTKVNFKDIDLNDSSADYEIYKGSTQIDLDEDVKITSSTSFKIKVYEGSELKETYTLKITKESASDSDEEDDDDNSDDIYLDKLELTTFDNKDIDLTFKKSTASYNLSVANSVTSIKIYAEPEYDDYTVRINGTKVDEDDDWTKKVTLNEGKNEIPVKIKDDDGNERTYTLNVTRTAKTQSSSTTNSSNSSSAGNSSVSGTTNISSNNTAATANNNTTANTAAKPSPANTAPTFSTTKLGWISQGSSWYFVQPDGKAVTGWVYSNYRWYYMDTNGVMRTGWVQVPSNNKWYYFDGSGAMLSNTTVGGYRLGSDGAWMQ